MPRIGDSGASSPAPCGFESRLPHSDTDERDPDKSRSFCVQTPASKDTCDAGQVGAEDKSGTPSQQVQDGVLRPKCVESVLADSPEEALPHDLRLVTDAWAHLPQAVRAGIVAMVTQMREGADGTSADNR